MSNTNRPIFGSVFLSGCQNQYRPLPFACDIDARSALAEEYEERLLDERRS